MKRFFAILLVGLTCLCLPAQTYWDASRADRLFTFGVRAGLNFSKQYNIEDYYIGDLKQQIGYHVGVEVDLNVCRSFSTNLGIEIIQKGFKADFSTDRTVNKLKNNATYLEIPLRASYRIALSDAAQFQINIGPYLAYGIGGKQKGEYTNGDFSNTNEMDSFDEYDGIKKTDFGMGYGVALTLSHLYFGVNYEHSLTKLGRDSRNDAKNSSLVISLGYNFN